MLVWAAVLAQPAIAQKFRDLACEPAGTTSAETRTFVDNEAARWKKLVADHGIDATEE